MQAKGSKSNQDSGAVGKVMSELMAALAAQEARSGLSRLAKRLADVRASDAQPLVVTSRRLRPRRLGWVLDAVCEVMADQVGPVRSRMSMRSSRRCSGRRCRGTQSAGYSPLMLAVPLRCSFELRGPVRVGERCIAHCCWLKVGCRPLWEEALEGCRDLPGPRVWRTRHLLTDRSAFDHRNS